ncbi:unnamed protein product [Protopolystoma xenopodis]|uniref:Uncharacterized protein n=1 Tax=Protopolystoma xenopodis TaxID=117903 RepID=A0A448WLR2_9PLAT|nr:unnamed protein product [Protopolystoma xenopodis]
MLAVPISLLSTRIHLRGVIVKEEPTTCCELSSPHLLGTAGWLFDNSLGSERLVNHKSTQQVLQIILSHLIVCFPPPISYAFLFAPPGRVKVHPFLPTCVWTGLQAGARLLVLHIAASVGDAFYRQGALYD